MSASTTQIKTEVTNSFEAELQKKLRNRNKKLQAIVELEAKIKSKQIVAKPEQLEKIATKVQVEAEIAEAKQYLDLFQKAKKEEAQVHKEAAKIAAKQAQEEKVEAIKTMANIMVLHTLYDNDQPITEELESGMKHFSQLFNGFLAKEVESYDWKQQMSDFVKFMQKLTSSSKEEVAETTYSELAQGVASILENNDYPETLTFKKEAVAQPEEEEAQPEPTPEPIAEKVAEEVAEEPEPAAEEKEEIKAEEESTPVEEEKVASAEIPKEEEKTSPVEKKEDDKPTNGRVHQKERGGRGGRGAYRGGDRGGERGRGGRGGRRNFRNNEDDGFQIVGEENARGRGGKRGGYRGRGRGGERGDRGRGGRRSARGEEGKPQQEEPVQQQEKAAE